MFSATRFPATTLRSQASMLSQAFAWLFVMFVRAYCWARTKSALILSLKIFEPARPKDFAIEGFSGKP